MAKKKSKPEKGSYREVIGEIDLLDFAREHYSRYGRSVLEDRAFPDFRDGMNPVNRRTLWSAYSLGIRSNSKFVKSARIVGDVLGRYHPHGDCLRGNTVIPLLNGKSTTIKNLSESGSGKKWVMSYDSDTGTYVPALAYAWRVGQSTKKMYRINLTNGSVFECTGNHPFYTTDGKWVAARNLESGMELVGGTFTTINNYKHLVSNEGTRAPVHRIVGEFEHGPTEDGEVFHHKNHTTSDNRPGNLEVSSRADHAVEHGDYLVGLDKGRQTQFGGPKNSPMRKAVRKKNSALLSEYNKQLAVIKAFKAVDLLKQRGLPVNEATYDGLRSEGIIYNLTSLPRLHQRGYSLKRILSEGTFRLNTEAATGHTRKLRTPKRKTKRVQFDLAGNFYDACAEVIRGILKAGYDLKAVGLNLFLEFAIQHARGNANKVVYTSRAKLAEIGFRNFKDLVRSIPLSRLCAINTVEVVELEGKEDFYDFTVDKYENMVVCSSNDPDSFVVAHNSSVYGAMVKMTNVNGVVSNIPIGLFEGEGNWGSLSNSAAAAMRYTEARLSKFSDEVLFNKFYMPVVRMIPNFDSSTVEPLILPALLPLVLLNGRFGIAPGATTNIPKLEPDGVFDVLRAAFKGEELTPKFLAKTLRLTSTFGGAEDESKENMRSESRREIFTSVRGSTNIVSPYEYDEKKRTMVFDGFAVDSIPPVIAKLIEIKAVQTARDISDVKDRFGRLEVQFKRLDEDQIDTAIGKVLKILSSRENVVLNFTVRTVNDLEQSDASMRPMTLIEVFTKWVKWRLALEVKACKYWVKEDDKEIRRIELLKQAVLMLDFIVGLLKNKKLTQADVYQVYAKKAKIEIEEAKYVLNRPIISLRNLEVIELDAKIRELRQHRSELVKRGKNPSKFALSQLKHLRTLVYSPN